MDLIVILLFILGLGLLTLGAEMLVRGASNLAAAAGVSALVIGLTVVAFGTSSPELAISIRSAFASDAGADVALGNVVGSNIFNVLFVLGLSAIVAPLVVSRQLVRLDVPIMIGISFLLYFVAYDGSVDRLEGVLLFVGVIAYTLFTFLQGRKESRVAAAAGDPEAPVPTAPGATRIALDVGLFLGGLACLVVGANWMVEGAVAMAQGLGVSELVISLTIVAAGTSLPEVATSILASLRGQRDIAVGNIVGSNLFNILAVLGASAAVAPRGIRVAPAALAFDIPVMVAVAILCLPIFFTGYRIARLEGTLFFTYYLAYTLYLVLTASEHAARDYFGKVMLFAVVPLTLLALAVTVSHQLWTTRTPRLG